MSDPPTDIGTSIFTWVARALGGPKAVARNCTIATLSVAETCIRLVHEGIASDINRMKDAMLRSSEAEADTKAAEAQKRQAEAVEAANRANLPKRRDAIAVIVREQERAKAAKTRSEAEAIRMDAETRRIEGVARAKAELITAISKLKQEGGDLFFDPKSIQRLLDCEVPPAIEQFEESSEGDGDESTGDS